MINVQEIIDSFYRPGSFVYRLYMGHAAAVAGKALEVARKVPHLQPDLKFIEEAALLHDIGMFLTDAPSIGCFGAHPYVCHGYLGRDLLEQRGMPRHALVCERHVGVGLACADIREHRLPLPERDALPQTLEEKIICYADKFFSKKNGDRHRQYTIEEVLARLASYGKDQVDRFMSFAKLFEEAGQDL